MIGNQEKSTALNLGLRRCTQPLKFYWQHNGNKKRLSRHAWKSTVPLGVLLTRRQLQQRQSSAQTQFIRCRGTWGYKLGT